MEAKKNEVDNHWKNFQIDTAKLPQQQFWKKIANLVNDRSQHAVQPIYDSITNDLVWDDQGIFEKLINTHVKRNHNDQYNFDENFKRDIEVKIQKIFSSFDVLTS